MTDLDTRVGKLEDDVSALKVETGKISVSLDYVVRGIDKIECSLETLTKPSAEGPSKWMKEIVTPQTVAIILAILASALGAPMVAQSILASPTVTSSVETPLEAPSEP